MNKLNLGIAWDFMMAKLRQTIVAAAGVTFGIATFIALVSFMTGLNKLLDNLVINRTPHVRLYNEIRISPQQPVDLSPRYAGRQHFIHSMKPKDRGEEIYNSKKIIAALKSDDRVLDVAPVAKAQVFFKTGTIEIVGVVNGIDVIAEDKLFSLSDYIIAGDLKDLATVDNSIVIGKGMADKMSVEVGDVIQVRTGSGNLSSLKVVGIIQFGLAEIDDTQSYSSLDVVQSLLGKAPSYITDLQVKLKDIEIAPAVSREYAKLFDVDAIDIKTANAQFETGSSVRSIISYSVGITLLIVAGFGIYNILNMLIYEKMDSIAILKAAGFSAADVKSIFISLSLMIGIGGGILGLLLGYLLSALIDSIPFTTASLPTIKTYPVNYNPLYYLIGIVFALLTTYIAGLFPARKAAKVDPVVIIRGK